jgi:hypothetical protein
MDDGYVWNPCPHKQHKQIPSFQTSSPPPSYLIMSSTTTTNYIRTADGKFQCPHCPKICDKQNTMYYHVKKNHLQDFKFTCEKCTRGFVQKSAYLQHLATAHPDDAAEDAEENPYAGACFRCPFDSCEHSAKTKANVIVHYTRTHCKEFIPAYGKTEACKMCEKTFASSTAYFYHTATCFKHDSLATLKTL